MTKKPTIEKQVPKASSLEQLSQAQRERLCFIDFNLYFLGEMGRVELAIKFDVAPAVFTRDMALYREYAPDNMVFNDKGKRYETTSSFKPLFQHDVHRSLFALSQGFGEGLDQASRSYLPAEFPQRLNQPDVVVLSRVSRAIHQKKVLEVLYDSYSSGMTTRQLVPHGLVDSGSKWLIRAFDRKTNQFRDFALNRISKAVLLNDVQDHERHQNDHQWLRMLMVELVPHPSARFPAVIERDYAMKDGKLVMNLRGAIAGYVLMQWAVDCSENHHLDPVRYRLWLKDSAKVLYGVESAVMAPGTNFTEHIKAHHSKHI